MYFANSDLPKRNITLTVPGQTLPPLQSGQTLWYYVAAVSVMAAAVGLFGMISALLASRRLVKAFEAFYVLSLMTQFALIIWALIWCKQNQTNFDTICTASKDGLVNLPIPGFASSWSCQRIFMGGILTLGIGGAVWISFNFYMTNRVIHYARELFAEKANRYKVLGEAATKELDREQQIPLNHTKIGALPIDQEQPSYRDEIEYKNPRDGDMYEHSHVPAAGFGSFGSGEQPQNHQYPIAPGFAHRSSAQGLELVNPYYGEPEQHAVPTTVDTTRASYTAVSGQSFVHGSTHTIASPFN
ncbi:hypothetical protein BGZ98_004223 [Dissophora globulifera]|nr:hypothetical protein BGZ98_004223 [Dissophora globulifera]